MRTTLLLCDYAQEVGGKLYILGGGWSMYRGSPVTMGLAVKIAVPWDEANITHDFSAKLVTEDGGHPVLPRAEGGAAPTPLEFQGRFETGRPPGIPPGSDLDAPFVVNIAGLPLAVGRYEWQVLIDQELVDRVSFSVMSA